MIFQVMKCEICDTEVRYDVLTSYDAPKRWLFLHTGSPRTTQPYHFCSSECLSTWIDISYEHPFPFGEKEAI
jgi:hypothetical protein